MVTQAIDDGLLLRIQKYIATDVNSRVPTEDGRNVRPEHVYILDFTRVMNNWQIRATITSNKNAGYYELTHDGELNKTICKIYHKISTHPAII